MTTLVTPTAAERWRFALVVFGVALGLFLATLAPTVTLWDAGEFLAASRIVGIPHPPGTPFWVILAHTWGTLVPIGEWAWRINLMTAVASAAGAACFGLVAWEALRRVPALAAEGLPRWLVPAGAGGAAIAGAFTFTNWHNSIEAEVYGIATFVIAFSCWLLHLWRERRGTPAADRILFLILYLLGLSVGNHLLALLAGPAIVGFLWLVGREAPLADAAARSREHATIAVVAGSWLLLVGVGLGSTGLALVGVVSFVAAMIWAATHGRAGFAGVAVVVALIGVTMYLVLFIRSGQNPMLDEADPDTWQALLDVISRKQYPPRTPWDDPTELSGAANPLRSGKIVFAQVANYALYFFWQWGRGLGSIPAHVVAFLAYVGLGTIGMAAHRRADRATWGLMLLLFLATGIGLMGYMNFKPGFSIFYNWWPNFSDHEVRERDYFFLVSFVVWGLWAGMGLTVLAAKAWRKTAANLRAAVTGGVLALAAIPVVTNWSAATRAQAPMRGIAIDLAYNMLNSVPPYGILVTFGDNDTFPLWYAQEVEGIRPDVTVLCLALAQTDWYLRQLRDNPTRPFVDSASAPIWRGMAGPMPDWPLHTMTDEEIAGVTSRLHQVDRDMPVQLGPVAHVIPAGAVLAPNDVGILRVIQQNLGRRPFAWSTTTSRNFFDLEPYMIQQGMANMLMPTLPDSTELRFAPRTISGILVDIPMTRTLVDSVYRYAEMDTMVARPPLDPAAEGVAGNLAQPAIILGIAADMRGDPQTAGRYYELALRIRYDEQLKGALDQARTRAMMIPRP
jgi:hypothetical protein